MRKWSMELENAGYKFLRDEHGRRAYVEHDALAFRQLKKHLDSKMTYDSAAKAVTAEYLRNENAEIALYANEFLPQEQQPNNERYEELNSKVDAIFEILKRLDERDKQLMEVEQLQKELAASAENDKPKISVWSRIIGKK